MSDCNLSYIPLRLHKNNRPPINEFYDKEILYRRCKIGYCDKPFELTLSDISINRRGIGDNILSEETDVLFNIDISNQEELYLDHEIVKMQVLNVDNQYKTYVFNEEPVRMELVHDPLPCNYSHSMFRIWFNGEITTFANWDSNLGAKKARLFRTLLRNELGKMILRNVELNT